MTWDTTLPAGTEAISNGDDRIREFKTDIQTALRGNATDGDEAKFPGSDTANPVYRYRGLKGTTAARPTAGQYGLYINTTLNTLQRDNGSAWQDVATLIPSGTVMVFFQTAAPTGWTKSTSHNDKALRVVSGDGGGSGGSTGFSSAFSGSHTHDLADDGGSTAGESAALYGGRIAGSDRLWVPNGAAGATTITHLQYHTDSETITFSPNYIDVIICTKD